MGFGIVGASGTVVDLGVFAFLTFVFSEIASDLVIRNIFFTIAFALSVINNYVWSYFWVWKDRERSFFKSFIKYSAATTIAYLIRFLIFNGLIELFKVTELADFHGFLLYYTFYSIAFLIAMCINFILIDKKVFKENTAGMNK